MPDGVNEPYLSIVVAARNDNHGGNLLRRMQIFLNALFEQCRRHAIDAELIVVEWNPPPGEGLDRALDWSRAAGACAARIVRVPSEIHARYRHGAALPLYQMIAKNVGLRRARGRHLLATNIDVIFSSELSAFLAGRALESGRMYRVDRHDAAADVPLQASVEEQIDYCRKHLLRVNIREGTFAPGEIPAKGQPAGAPGLLGAIAGLPARFRNLMPVLAEAGPFVTIPVSDAMREFARAYVKTGSLADAAGAWLRPAISTPLPLLHTNACGDFTLMAREHWHDLRGYPEFDMYSFNIDSVLCYAAHYGGAREEALPEPMVIYHVEHGSGWTPEGHQAMFRRLAEKGIPTLSWMELMQWAEQMRRYECPIIFNRDDWGLASDNLEERTFGAG